MPTTPDGITYPAGTDGVDLPGDLQVLAEGVGPAATAAGAAAGTAAGTAAGAAWASALDDTNIAAVDANPASAFRVQSDARHTATIAAAGEADGGSGGAPGSVWEKVAAWAGADAYIDFTTKADGDPPGHLDTGQVVDFVTPGQNGWKPQIASGQLIHGTLPASGVYAAYLQAPCDGDIRAAGTQWVVNSADGSTDGTMCIAVWADIYEPTGVVVPQTPGHITISTTTGEWKWWVSDGGGTGSDHLKVVKSGTFTAPASDGVAVWEAAFYIDPDTGVGYLYLPGVDATTGTRYVTVTNAEISAALIAASLPAKTFAELLDGADVLSIEHFASTAANTAIFPRFLSAWGETLRPSRDRSRAVRAKATAAPASTFVQYPNGTQQVKAITSTSAPVYTDTGNTIPATIQATVGPNGKIHFDIPAVTIEFGGPTSRAVTDAAITSAATTLTSATAVFATTDVGRMVVVKGAGPGGSDLVTTIASRTNSTTVTLSDAAGTTVSGAGCRIHSPAEVAIQGRMTGPSSSRTTPNPDNILRGRAGERHTIAVAFVATGRTPGAVETWTFETSLYTPTTGTANLIHGGTNTTVYPTLSIKATPE